MIFASFMLALSDDADIFSGVGAVMKTILLEVRSFSIISGFSGIFAYGNSSS